MDQARLAKRECMILRACWRQWRRPVDVADEIGECRKTVAKHMKRLCSEELLRRKGIEGTAWGVRYRTVDIQQMD